jgi:mannose-6-phosphate isomerase-like protein (cupin superfamily)
MIHRAAGVCAVVLLVFPPLARAQTPPSSPTAPAPLPPEGGPGVYRSSQTLADTLQASATASPALAISPVLVTDRYSALEVRRGSAGPPATHLGWSELHYILNGSGVLVTGGKIVPATADSPARIEGGVARPVKTGDAVIVPPGTPHQYTAVSGYVTTLEVRFPDAAPRRP